MPVPPKSVFCKFSLNPNSDSVISPTIKKQKNKISNTNSGTTAAIESSIKQIRSVRKMAEELSKKEKILNTIKKEKPRFRLLFAHSLEIGKSPLSVLKLKNFHEPVVTSKFYSIYDTSKLAQSEGIGLINKEISRLKSLGPREKYQEPISESHRYGWFQEKCIQPNPETERIHFPRRNSEMVIIQNLLDNTAKAEQLYYMTKCNK